MARLVNGNPWNFHYLLRGPLRCFAARIDRGFSGWIVRQFCFPSKNIFVIFLEMETLICISNNIKRDARAYTKQHFGEYGRLIEYKYILEKSPIDFYRLNIRYFLIPNHAWKEWFQWHVTYLFCYTGVCLLKLFRANFDRTGDVHGCSWTDQRVLRPRKRG